MTKSSYFPGGFTRAEGQGRACSLCGSFYSNLDNPCTLLLCASPQSRGKLGLICCAVALSPTRSNGCPYSLPSQPDCPVNPRVWINIKS